MKNLITAIILAGYATMANAQFHTVARHPSVYRIEEVREVQTPKGLPANGKAETEISDAKSGEQQAEESAEDKAEERKEWIRRYLSVSYPLDEIVVNSRFGVRKDPFTGKERRHNGLDLRARFVDVYSMMDGEVVKVASNSRSGKYVTIRYGAYTVSYCHLSKPLVRKGDKVMPGEVIAVSGNSGKSTGSHLHITAKFRGKHIDPDILLRFVRETRQEAWTWLTGNG